MATDVVQSHGARPSWPESRPSPSSSSTSTSLSSLVSSASGTSAKLPAGSSQSDIPSSDHSAGPPKPGGNHDPSGNAAGVQRNRFPSLAAAMGHAHSKSQTPSNGGAGPSSPISQRLALTTAAAITSVKLKRAFAARRKPTVDTSQSLSDAELLRSRTSPTSGTQTYDAPSPSQTRGPKLSLQMAANVFTKRSNRAPAVATPITPPPVPPKPPKPLPPLELQVPTSSAKRDSIIPVSPGISSAVNFIRNGDNLELGDSPVKSTLENGDAETAETKEGWRKSDATITHHTIRPGASMGSRTPRPLSTAESNHTIVAPMNKRHSVIDQDVPEEGDSYISGSEDPHHASASSASSLRSKHLRSSSPNARGFGPRPTFTPPSTSTSFEFKNPPPMPNNAQMSTPTRETPTLTRAAANGIIAPTNTQSNTAADVRGRLAAWTPMANPKHVQSKSTSFAPAGLAKRAVEKMGRWGGFSSGSSNSGYSSSSSSTGPSSYSDHGLTRTASNQSDGKHSKQRRTPDAPSGAWSINSSLGSTSISDSDPIPQTGPSLGNMLRAPLVRMKGPGSGIVFGRDLRSVVKATRLTPEPPNELDRFHVFQERALPSLALRCAQHLMIWGIQEEGLFRVSGRPAHVNLLRSEFDSGADYDMRECSPGELDPHAVASIFKAFLRELPEPLLTRGLMPYFEEALASEGLLSAHEPSSTPGRLGGRGPGLPSNPRAVGLPSGPKAGGNFVASLRKPPSLSTLAMPSFNGIPPPSKSLTIALTALISQLPTENRDLLHTVVDLIKETSKEFRQTKMPLSNLLLVFCPSLSMSPPMLRALCEADGIWGGKSPESPVLNIKRETVVVDIAPESTSPKSTSAEDAEDEDDADDDDASFSDAKDDVNSDQDIPVATPEELVPEGSQSSLSQIQAETPEDSVPKQKPSLANDKEALTIEQAPAESITSSPAVLPPPPVLAEESKPLSHSLHHRAKSSDELRKGIPRTRPMGPRRQAVPAALFTDKDLTSSSSIDSPEVSAPYYTALPPSSSSANSLASSSTELVVDGQPPNNSQLATIQFPSKSGSAPSTPISPKRSAPLLSLTTLAGITSSAPATPLKRLKKSSMNLFRRSSSALSERPQISSPYLQSPGSSDSSVNSAVTAPQPSPYYLDTPVDSSKLMFELGLDLGIELEPETPNPHQVLAGTSASEVYVRAASRPAEPVPHLRLHPTRQFNASSASVASSNHLGDIDNEDADDWTKSVLIAADLSFTAGK